YADHGSKISSEPLHRLLIPARQNIPMPQAAIDAVTAPCPKCRADMVLAAITPHPVAHQLARHTYLCAACNQTKTYILPLASPAAGWQRPQTVQQGVADCLDRRCAVCRERDRVARSGPRAPRHHKDLTSEKFFRQPAFPPHARPDQQAPRRLASAAGGLVR